ncbi:hypothetical protein P700755_001376 [Psychroflexus torquis ATCC 700755]|uniref:Uncharacterized protein n=1 Tax=Psychroflexus torquis (strain ATCC 700755 / CIP 106069 / ACAM 623) TaxID=313595 RepID=K4ID08_PSYTT|nr:hypothetical protein P700755_001376 [Psychroflexus torquis ATCC 700755]
MWDAPRLSLGVFKALRDTLIFRCFVILSYKLIMSWSPKLVKTDILKLFFNHLKAFNR